ncbi:tRNA (5-methylaminomethyl-2-thiouridine)(34)-methyltransferase MnmD [Pseudoroseicyclus tamaricis]|uniref:tRNA (5-methylaminomethyl-2-thiouridine)(34)-methyltransferase MnmD n=1 Tax=Pseudoroseicyclus tamaricis TaxID=2705421 RepID=A0A6B2JTA7_9RHOB|nr:tRNA (5-methylaminomethyl-2-thiouridine)(34)-methyltransferase MnmD [Pseudoroseicyclus tamaricis]NDU99403.1 tRNA (5-methylaminomethyl-2-thiouridine)(34)-methyltransferase MnmD [Pseudoroseicyclus tamaricis]
MQEKRAEVAWKEGVPVATRFDDPYFSLADGAAETAHVFLAGNGLPGRFRDGFSIAELGFGTGLNFLVTLAAWKASGTAGDFAYASFEAFPMAAEDLATAHAAFPALEEEAEALRAAMEAGPPPWHIGPAFLTLIEGDARETLARWGGRADAWFLDGFAPAKNPELWEPPLLAEVARHTAPGGSFATYTAAGHVRRALAEAGFTVERRTGYGAKRHMTAGVL